MNSQHDQLPDGLITQLVEQRSWVRIPFKSESRAGGGRGVLPEKLGGDVRPASQNPYPIYDQDLRYSLPNLWPD